MNIPKFLLTLALFVPATAEAAYVRIWSGQQKAGLSAEAFIRGLNHALLPATGALGIGPAKLESYLPVLLPESLVAVGLPEEVALLSYANEADYRSYRATAEGLHYGDLHWDLFDRATSSSLVPAAYAGTLDFDQAYEIAGGDPTWSKGAARFRVVMRSAGSADRDFLATLAARIEVVKASRPTSYYVVVFRDYALEYLDSDEILALPSAFDAELTLGTSLAAGSGVRYPVRDDAAQPGVRAVWEHHIAAWTARDLDALVADYHEGSIVIRNDEIYRGKVEIRELFADLFARFDLVTDATIGRIIVSHGTVYLSWSAAGHRGTDTFAIASGRIDAQTITSDPEFWRP